MTNDNLIYFGTASNPNPYEKDATPEQIAERQRKIDELRKAIEPLLSASKADPNAKKGRGTEGLWLTINLRQSDYEAIVKAYNEIT